MSYRESPKNIYRIETPTARGWQVRFKRQNEVYSKFFSDSKYDDALKAAEFWRDGIRDRLPDKLDPRDVSAESRSTTGVRGVSVTHDNKKVGYIHVTYTDKTGRTAHMYSIRKWGLRKAAWRAARALGQARGQSQDEIQELFEKTYNNLLKQLPDGFQIEPDQNAPKKRRRKPTHRKKT